VDSSGGETDGEKFLASLLLASLSSTYFQNSDLNCINKKTCLHELNDISIIFFVIVLK
jgi:hypothetical protein